MADLASERRESFLRWMRAERLNAHRIALDSGLPKMTVSDYVTGKTSSLSGEREAIIARQYGYSVDAIWGSSDPEERDISFVTAWREYRSMTIEELASAAGTTVQIMELVEAGQLPLTGKRRRAVADALKVTQGFLDLDPSAPENSLLVAAADVPSPRRSDATRVLHALVGTGTDG